MTAADRMDLALCGGYELVECACDCPRCKGQYWERVEMPVVGCETYHQHKYQRLYRFAFDAIDEAYRETVDEDMKFLQGAHWIGNTITVKRPERWQG